MPLQDYLLQPPLIIMSCRGVNTVKYVGLMSECAKKLYRKENFPYIQIKQPSQTSHKLSNEIE